MKPLLYCFVLGQLGVLGPVNTKVPGEAEEGVSHDMWCGSGRDLVDKRNEQRSD